MWIKITACGFAAVMCASGFGLFALGAAFYSASQMRRIDDAYCALGVHENAGALALARVSRNAMTMRAAIADLLIATSDAGNKRAEDELSASRDRANAAMDEATKALPDDRDLGTLKAAIATVVDKDYGEAIRLGKVATSPADVLASQAVLLEQCSPKFPALAEALVNESRVLAKEAHDKDDALTVSTNAARCTAWRAATSPPT